LPAEDLKQEGFLGFLRAFELYDPKRAAFLTYAQYWIKMAMYDYCYHTAYMINIPNEHHVIASKCQKIIQARGERVPTKELSKLLNIPEAKIIKAMLSVKLLRNYTNLDDIDKFTASETLIELPKKFKIFQIAQEILTPQEYFILQHLFGSDCSAQKTLAWVGQILSISKERVRQIKNIALGKLTEFFERNPGYGKEFHSTIVD
jgi:RNA polymerase sigma factor (sigma-70 family)